MTITLTGLTSFFNLSPSCSSRAEVSDRNPEPSSDIAPIGNRKIQREINGLGDARPIYDRTTERRCGAVQPQRVVAEIAASACHDQRSTRTLLNTYTMDRAFPHYALEEWCDPGDSLEYQSVVPPQQSIRCRLVDVIDDNDIDWPFCRF